MKSNSKIDNLKELRAEKKRIRSEIKLTETLLSESAEALWNSATSAPNRNFIIRALASGAANLGLSYLQAQRPQRRHLLGIGRKNEDAQKWMVLLELGLWAAGIFLAKRKKESKD